MVNLRLLFGLVCFMAGVGSLGTLFAIVAGFVINAQ